MTGQLKYQIVNPQKNYLANNENCEDLPTKNIYEDALAVVRRGDLEAFLALENDRITWNALSEEDLGHLTYSLFESCLDLNEDKKNKIGVIMLEALIISHPNANTSVERLARILTNAAYSGNFDVFEMLQQKHPKWQELRAQDIEELIGETLTSASGGQRAIDFESRRAEGKENIVSLLINHNNWDRRSPSQVCNFACLLADHPLYISSSKMISFIDEMKGTKGWRDMDAKLLARFLNNVGLDEHSEYYYQLAMNHPSWDKLDKNMLKHIACSLGNSENPNDDSGLLKIRLLNCLIEHSNWANLQTKDLLAICKASENDYPYEFIFQISKHPNWNALSPRELFSLMVPPLRLNDIRIYHLLMNHPNWNNIDKNSMATLAMMAANEDLPWLLSIVSTHPEWKNFTGSDLFEIIKWSYWCRHLSEIIEILSKHEKWASIQTKVEEFLKKHNNLSTP